MLYYLLQFFEYRHLPKDLQPISRLFSNLADDLSHYEQNSEMRMCLRKLLEAKDCAVRSHLYCAARSTFSTTMENTDTKNTEEKKDGERPI